MSDEEEPHGAVGDLMADLVDLAADLIAVCRDDGPEAIRGVLLRLCSVEEDLTPEVQARLSVYPGGVRDAFALTLAAMVNPDTPIRAALRWTEPMANSSGGTRTA